MKNITFPTFISLDQIQIGDLICWTTCTKDLNYLFVEDIEEGETNFVKYDENGKALYADGITYQEEYWPSIILKGKVMGPNGVRDFPQGYHLGKDSGKILLLNRCCKLLVSL
jgi:hypothetical protein